MAVMGKKSTPVLDLSKLCPAMGCINGITWTGEGPAEQCPICHGTGRVSLSDWMKYTLREPARSTG